MLTKWYRQIIVMVVVLAALVGCGGAETPEAPAEPAVGMANPASVFCEEQGGRLEIRDESGGQVGYCLFPDGSECEEWAFFRGECAPAALLCATLAADLEDRLGVPVEVTSPSPFVDPISGQTAEGCRAEASGTGLDFSGVDVVITAVQDTFQAANWQADQGYSAGGPTGAFGAYRQGDSLCLWLSEWMPSADASCPDDQPISACELAPEQTLYTVNINCK
jgi:uncharacterized protein